MNNFFPVSVIDDFFQHPDDVVKLANSLKFKQSDGFYPGKRTGSLHLLNYEFFNTVVLKVLSLHYNLMSSDLRYDNVTMHFQKIKPFNKKQINHILNKGLIHQDAHVLLAGVVYLNKEPDLNSGTSLYMLTEKRSKEYDEKLASKKKEIYKVNQNKLTKNEIIKYQKLIKDCNKGFKEVVKVNNVYNRLILYPGSYFHAGNYEVTQERLTLVFFIKKIKCITQPPITRKNLINERT